MYFWKTQDLAKKINDGSLSEEDKKNYYIVISIITIASLYIAIGGGTTDGIATLTECILSIAITALGINVTFKSNKGNEGNDYIARVAILSVPITVKLFVFGILAGLVGGIIAGIIGGEESADLGQWSMVFISIVLQVIFFWRLNVHLSSINT
ncbi:MAG: hypothetical protein JKX82_09730 [Oleispira sp.]|nr:hypothetical protein [Oleispira sp.]